MMAEDIVGLAVRVAMDNSRFEEGMKSLKRQLNIIQSDFQKNIAVIKNFGQSLDGLKLNADNLSKKIEVQRQIVQAYSEQLNKSKATLEQNSKKLLELKDKLESAKKAYEQEKKVLGENAEVVQKLKAEYEKISREYENQVKLVKNNARTVDNYTIQLNNATAKLNEFEAELQDLNKKITQQSSGWYKLSTQLNTVSEKTKAIGEKLKDVGKSLTTHVTLPIIAAGTTSSKFAIDFEDAMAKVATIADTSVNFETLRKGILNLSEEYGIAAKDLAEAEYQTISAGVSTAKSLEFLEIATKTAQAGFSDVVTSVDALSSVMNSYKLSIEGVNRVSNEMLAAQNYGKTTFNEMANSIGNVIPLAAAVNMQTNELFASLATLTKNGISTAEAVTGLRSALSNIIKPSEEAKKLAKELGIQFDVASLKSKGWINFLNEIMQKTKGDQRALGILFGDIEGANAITALINNYQDLLNAQRYILKSTNAVDEAFKKVSSTTGYQFRKTLVELQNAGIELGEALLPLIKELTKEIKPLVDAFNSLSPATKQFIVQAGLATAAAGPLLNTFGNLFVVTSNVTKGIGSLSSALSKLKVRGETLNGIKNLGTALGGISTSALLAVGGIAAVIGTAKALSYSLEQLYPGNWSPQDIAKLKARKAEIEKELNKEITWQSKKIKLADITTLSAPDLAITKKTSDVKNVTWFDEFLNSLGIKKFEPTEIEKLKNKVKSLKKELGDINSKLAMYSEATKNQKKAEDIIKETIEKTTKTATESYRKAKSQIKKEAKKATITTTGLGEDYWKAFEENGKKSSSKIDKKTKEQIDKIKKQYAPQISKLDADIKKLLIQDKDKEGELKDYQKALELTSKKLKLLNEEYSKLIKIRGKDSEEAQQVLNQIQNTQVAYEQLKGKIKDTTQAIKEEYEKTKEALLSSIKEYVNRVKDQAERFRKTWSLFEMPKLDKYVSPQRLLNRLKAQLEIFKNWRNDLQKLMSRSIKFGDVKYQQAWTNLIKELGDLGPAAANYIKAIASMSDEQIKQYVMMYEQIGGHSKSVALGLANYAKEPVTQIQNQNIYINIDTKMIAGQYDADKLAETILKKLKLKGAVK